MRKQLSVSWLLVALALSTAGAVAAEVNPGLLKASDGAIYGTIRDDKGGGLFRIDPDGSNFKNIHDFRDPGLGLQPLAGVIEGEDGTLYGTTSRGGDPTCPLAQGCGTVYRIAKDGSGYQVLHGFTGFPDGRNPDTSLVVDGDLLYGRIEIGGDGARDC